MSAEFQFTVRDRNQEIAARGRQSSTNLMSAPPPDDPHESLNHLANLMQKELDHLLEQKAGLRRRMQKLRRMLLQLRGKPQNASAKNKSSSNSRRARAAAREKGRIRRELYEQLWRACRIAFMESGGVASPDHIYTLVKRRGSFSFEALEEEPMAAIDRTLTLMLYAGEAERTGDERNPVWRYMTAK